MSPNICDVSTEKNGIHLILKNANLVVQTAWQRWSEVLSWFRGSVTLQLDFIGFHVVQEIQKWARMESRDFLDVDSMNVGGSNSLVREMINKWYRQLLCSHQSLIFEIFVINLADKPVSLKGCLARELEGITKFVVGERTMTYAKPGIQIWLCFHIHLFR